MKKKIILSIIMMGLVAARINVKAATNAAPGDDKYSTLQSSYNAGITTTKISNSDWVTIYGKSVCDSNGSCVNSYVDGIKDRETVLTKSITCTNGQKYITYDTNVSSGKSDTGAYTDASGNAVKSATVYWSEDIYVTCTDTNSGIPSNTGNTNVGNNNAGSTNDGTVENPQTGVNTYFVVLGIVAVVSYGFMILVKKFNLFKKI